MFPSLLSFVMATERAITYEHTALNGVKTAHSRHFFLSSPALPSYANTPERQKYQVIKETFQSNSVYLSSYVQSLYEFLLKGLYKLSYVKLRENLMLLSN